MTAPSITEQQARETIEAFERFNGNVTYAARHIGISRPSFYNRLDRAKVLYGLTVSYTAEDEPPAPFVAPELPSPDEPLEALLERKRALADRVKAADSARTLVQVKITIPGPIGMFLMGDPHVDNDGCDFPRLERDIALVAKQPRILAVNMGDVTDNWIGRLERLHAHSSVKANDAWRLAEWLFSQPVNWLALIGGNHDAWSGSRDPLKWITKGRVPLYEPNAARLALQHPNGAETRFHGRHTFRGQSQFTDLHGLRREMREGWRDHIIAAAHLHSGEDGAQINGDGFVTQMVRLSGYKRVDSYAKEHGFKSKPMHPSALVIIDPDAPEHERGRAWLAPDIETGVDYLNFIAKRAAA